MSLQQQLNKIKHKVKYQEGNITVVDKETSEEVPLTEVSQALPAFAKSLLVKMMTI